MKKKVAFFGWKKPAPEKNFTNNPSPAKG